MKRREFLYGLSCILAGMAFTELKYMKIRNDYLNQKKPDGWLTIATSSNCNLNCKCCEVYAPLAKPEFVTYDQFSKDFTKIKKLYDNTDNYQLTYFGGEPLLNPDFEKIIEKSVELFPKGKKNVLTNGILLKDKDENFWRLMKRSKTEIDVSFYPIDIDREIAAKFAKKYGVELNYFPIKSDKLYSYETHEVIDTEYNQEGKNWSKTIIDIEGKQDYKNKIYTCPHINKGINIYARGNIYYCYVHAYINTFRDYFKLDIPITKDDYITVQDIKSREQLEEFLSTPKQLCRFCKQCHNICYDGEALEWGFSERKITEWT